MIFFTSLISFWRETTETILSKNCGDINIDVKLNNFLKSEYFDDVEAIGFKMTSIEAKRITHCSRT